MSTLFRIPRICAVIVIFAVLAIAGWRSACSGPALRPLGASVPLLFSISLDIPVLVGLVYLIGRASSTTCGRRFEHMAVMIALIIAHLPMRWRNAAGHARAMLA